MPQSTAPLVRLLAGIALLGWAFPAAAVDAACGKLHDAAVVEAALDDLEASWGRDPDAFLAASALLDARLPCLDEPVTQELAARVHLGRVLVQDYLGNQDRTREALAAYRAAVPAASLPEAVGSKRADLASALQAVNLNEGQFASLPEVAQPHLVLDGRSATQRPLSWPSLLQYTDGARGIEGTAYLWPGDPLPDFVPRSDPGAELAPRGAGRAPTRALLYGAIGAGVASLATVGVNRGCNAAFLEGGSVEPGPARCTQITYVTSLGLGLTATGLGAGAVLGGRR